MILEKQNYIGEYTTYIKLYPAMFGKKQAHEGVAMSKSVTQYIAALYADEEFRKEFCGNEHHNASSPKTFNSLYSESSYKRYVEGYEWAVEELTEMNRLLVQDGFSQYQFNSYESILKFIRAIRTILYHASTKTIETSIIKLVTWLQYLRQGLKNDYSIKMDSSALFFFSSKGGTGKSEVLHAFNEALYELGIKSSYISMEEISDRFTPSAIKENDVLIFEDAQFTKNLGGVDINLSRINTLIDRSTVQYRAMYEKGYPIKTNLTFIGATNNRYRNRRYSLIPIKNEQIDLQKHKPPTPEALKQAWIDAIYNCPDPKYKWLPVKIMNEKNATFISYNVVKIFDLVNDEDDAVLMKEIGVRSIIDKVTKGTPTDRAVEFLLDDIRFLIQEGIATKIEGKKKRGLRVSRISIDLEKFRDLMQVEDIDVEAHGEEVNSSSVNIAMVEDVIMRLYVSGNQGFSDEEITNIKEKIKHKKEQIEFTETLIQGKNTDKKIKKRAKSKLLNLLLDLNELQEKLKNIEYFKSLLAKYIEANPPPP